MRPILLAVLASSLGCSKPRAAEPPQPAIAVVANPAFPPDPRAEPVSAQVAHVTDADAGSHDAEPPAPDVVGLAHQHERWVDHLGRSADLRVMS